MASGWVQDIRAGQQATKDIIKCLEERGYDKTSIGVVGFGETRPRVISETVPYQQFQQLREALPSANIVAAGWLPEQARMIKSNEEIELLIKSSELANAMAEAMASSARAGVREHEVYASMLDACLSRGGEEDMIWISSGSAPPPHAKRPPASSRMLNAGDLLVCEYHACYAGYLSGAEISLSIGEPGQEYQRIHEVCVESQRQGIAAMRPGAYIEEAVQAFRRPIMDAGLASIECGFHGHGLASPEFPSCMYGGDSGSWQEHAYARTPQMKFQENMVFATATDLFNPRRNKDTGLMLGRTVLITSEGPKELTGIALEERLPVVNV